MIAAVLALLLVAAPVRPDPSLTPGAADPRATAELVCRRGYTRDARHVTPAQKRQVFREYGVPATTQRLYEIDHLVSLELGGANDTANLWPEPYCPLPRRATCFGAREKDVVETTLHREVCARRMTLDQAQAIIRRDWLGCYRKLKAKKECG
jgi:hypothetical protein